jgi:hypothetical protein
MMAEAGMMLQAQSLLDQLPMDMGTAKDEIETELREYGDAARQGIEEIQAGHKQEIDKKVTAHKTSLHSLIGPSREYNTLPTPAQHAARTTLRNEIATMIRNDLGANTADERWTRLTKHITKELDRKIETLAANHDREMEAIEGRIAIAQVAMDKSESQVTNEEQERKNKRLDDKEIKETIQQRLTKIEREAESAIKAALKSYTAQCNRNDIQQNEGTRLLERIEKLEDTVEEQKQ